MLRYLVLCWLLLSTASAWAIKPVAKWWAKPDTLGLKYQNLTLTTPDHVQLAAWLVAPVAGAPTQHTTMVLAGTDSGNMSSFIYQARALAGRPPPRLGQGSAQVGHELLVVQPILVDGEGLAVPKTPIIE
jgi:hypothetical protein